MLRFLSDKKSNLLHFSVFKPLTNCSRCFLKQAFDRAIPVVILFTGLHITVNPGAKKITLKLVSFRLFDIQWWVDLDLDEDCDITFADDGDKVEVATSWCHRIPEQTNSTITSGEQIVKIFGSTELTLTSSSSLLSHISTVIWQCDFNPLWFGNLSKYGFSPRERCQKMGRTNWQNICT